MQQVAEILAHDSQFRKTIFGTVCDTCIYVIMKNSEYRKLHQYKWEMTLHFYQTVVSIYTQYCILSNYTNRNWKWPLSHLSCPNIFTYKIHISESVPCWNSNIFKYEIPESCIPFSPHSVLYLSFISTTNWWAFAISATFCTVFSSTLWSSIPYRMLSSIERA